MGRQTRTFRQTKRAGNADTAYKNYAQVNSGAWHTKVWNWVKVRGKGADSLSNNK